MKIDYYNMNDKIHPWQDEPDSKTVWDALDYHKLGISHE